MPTPNLPGGFAHLPKILRQTKKLSDRRLFVAYSYTMIRFPLSHYTQDQWVDMFRAAGWMAGKPDPSQPLTIYRGAHPDYKTGLSWTPSMELALLYARQWNTGGVYQITLTQPEIIATITHTDGTQLIVDARKHDVQLVPDSLKENPQGHDPLNLPDWVNVVDTMRLHPRTPNTTTSQGDTHE